jgi:hypothetical protein
MPYKKPLTFFDRVEDDIEGRVLRLMQRMTPEQIESLQVLDSAKREYYRDAEDVMMSETMALLSDEDVDAQTCKQVALAGGHVLLRGITLHTLAMAEILVFGKMQAPLPLESTRFSDDED